MVHKASNKRLVNISIAQTSTVGAYFGDRDRPFRLIMTEGFGGS